jgi:hypothetical protein
LSGIANLASSLCSSQKTKHLRISSHVKVGINVVKNKEIKQIFVPYGTILIQNRKIVTIKLVNSIFSK